MTLFVVLSSVGPVREVSWTSYSDGVAVPSLPGSSASRVLTVPSMPLGVRRKWVKVGDCILPGESRDSESSE